MCFYHTIPASYTLYTIIASVVFVSFLSRVFFFVAFFVFVFFRARFVLVSVLFVLAVGVDGYEGDVFLGCLLLHVLMGLLRSSVSFFRSCFRVSGEVRA